MNVHRFEDTQTEDSCALAYSIAMGAESAGILSTVGTWPEVYNALEAQSRLKCEQRAAQE